MNQERPIQYLDDSYIERCRGMTADQILEFLDDYQKMFFGVTEKCQAISLKVEPSLLRAFRTKAKLSGVAYQTQIKKLMRDWVAGQ